MVYWKLEAFHTVDYNILLAKLEYYRICGAVNDWFKSYLSDRRQFVYINIQTNLCLNKEFPKVLHLDQSFS